MSQNIFIITNLGQGAVGWQVNPALSDAELSAGLETMQTDWEAMGDEAEALRAAAANLWQALREGDNEQILAAREELEQVLQNAASSQSLSRHRFGSGQSFRRAVEEVLGLSPDPAALVCAPDDEATPRSLLPPPLDHPRPIGKILGDLSEAKRIFIDVVDIRSPEEARLVLEYLAQIESDDPHMLLLKQACQEALKWEIPIHWERDPRHRVSYTKRSPAEAQDWEKQSAHRYGIFLLPDSESGGVRGSTLFHELAHALPQKILGELFPQIPWAPAPTDQDSYAQAVEKQLIRLAMQEAYAYALSEGELPNLTEGEYLGTNHLILYSFHLAVENAHRLQRKESPLGWEEAASLGDVSRLQKLQDAYDEIKPLVDQILSDSTHPLYGYFQRLIPLLFFFDLRLIPAKPFQRTNEPSEPNVAAASLSGGDDLVRILESHAQALRRLANVISNTGQESPLATLSALIPEGEQGRFWGSVWAKRSDPWLFSARDQVFRGLSFVASLYLQGFVEDAERILAEILSPQDIPWGPSEEGEIELGDAGLRLLPRVIRQMEATLLTVARFGKPEAIKSFLDILEPEVSGSFSYFYQKLILDYYTHFSRTRDIEPLRTDGDPAKTFEYLRSHDDIVRVVDFDEKDFQAYLANRPGLEFFLNLGRARKYLLERGLNQEANRIGEWMREKGVQLARAEQDRFVMEEYEGLSATRLRELAAIPEELGGGWTRVLEIFEGLAAAPDNEANAHIWVQTLSELVQPHPELVAIPLAIRERLSQVWSEGIDQVEGALTEEEEAVWVALLDLDSDRKEVINIIEVSDRADQLRLAGSRQTTAGIHFVLGQSVDLYRFAKEGESEILAEIQENVRFRIQGEAFDKQGKPRGVVWDAHAQAAYLTLGTNPHLYWVELLVEDSHFEEALDAIEKGLETTPPVYHLAYARPLYRLKALMRESHPDWEASRNKFLEKIQKSLQGIDFKTWRRYHLARGERGSRELRNAYEMEKGRLERERFLGLVAEGAHEDIEAVLVQASIYDALASQDWLHAAQTLDQQGAKSNLVFSLYARAVDVAEMRSEVGWEWGFYLNAIDRSNHLSAEQKDGLFTQLIEVLLVLADQEAKGGLKVDAKKFLFGETSEFENKNVGEASIADTFHQIWERARVGGYRRAQARLLAGIQEMQSEWLAKDPIGTVAVLDPLVREVLYACGESCVQGSLVDQTLGPSHALGETFFGKSEWTPLSFETLGREDASQQFLATIDPQTTPSLEQILAYRYLAYGGEEITNQSVIHADWFGFEAEEGRDADAPPLDDPIEALMRHFGVTYLDEFFEKYPFVAGVFFFQGFHPLVSRSSLVARQALLYGKELPSEVQGMALEVLFHAGEVSPYVWQNFEKARAASHPERVLNWVRRLDAKALRNDPMLETEADLFYPDPLLVSLWEETGYPLDAAWRKLAAAELQHWTKPERDIDDKRSIKLPKGLGPYLSVYEFFSTEGYGVSKFFGRLISEDVIYDVDASEWLLNRGLALAPAASVVLPEAFDRLDARLVLLVRLFLAGLEPSVRRHVLRQLASVGEAKPEYVLQRLVELVDLPGLGQFMANLPESVVPENYRKALRASLERVAPSAEAEIREVVRQVHDQEVYQRRFANAHFQPVAAGKAGEVWEVKERGKRPVILKVVPPNKLRRSALAMASLESWADRVSYLPDIFRGVSVPSTLERFRERLGHEMDYTHEARNIETFQALAKEEGLVLPKVKWVSPSILEMARLALVAIEDLTQEQLVALDQATGRTLAKALVHQGWMYTDPHAGQMKGSKWKTKDGTIVVLPTLLDFGQVMNVSEDFLPSLHGLIFGLLKADQNLVRGSLKGLITFALERQANEANFYRDLGKVLSAGGPPSTQIEKILDLAAAHGGTVTWELTEFIRMVLFWESAMRENRAPHNDFISTYLAPELVARFGIP